MTEFCYNMHTLCKLFIVSTLFSFASQQADAQCTWPDAFRSSTWYDSGFGTLTFTTLELTGISVTYSTYGTTSIWRCQDTTQYTSDNILIIRSNTSFAGIGGTPFYVYLCLKLTYISDASYTYYLQAARETQTNKKVRVTTHTDSTLTSSSTCFPAQGAVNQEFHTLVKQGSESTAYKPCPSVLHGHFDFNITSAAGVTSCNNPSANTPNAHEHLDVCADKTKLHFSIKCTGQSLVYASGDVFCITSQTHSGTTFVALFNPDTTVDSTTTYRFSCLAISADSLTATIVYKACTTSMTSSTLAQDHAGVNIGKSIVFHPYGTSYMFDRVYDIFIQMVIF